jgi:hypothetical protein
VNDFSFIEKHALGGHLPRFCKTSSITRMEYPSVNISVSLAPKTIIELIQQVKQRPFAGPFFAIVGKFP